MAELRGYGGQVDWETIIDSDLSYNVHSWSLDVSADALDVTNFDSTGWRKQLSGLKGWTGTIEAYIPSDVSLRFQPSDVGSEATLKLYVDSTHYYYGKAICTGVSPSVSVDGVETQTFNFTGSSDLFYS